MSSHLIELAVRRGELKARIEAQRRALAAHAEPVAGLLGKVDHVVAGVHWLKAHPREVGVAAAAFLVVRPRRAWRWLRRGFVVWKAVRALRDRLPAGFF